MNSKKNENTNTSHIRVYIIKYYLQTIFKRNYHFMMIWITRFIISLSHSVTFEKHECRLNVYSNHTPSSRNL